MTKNLRFTSLIKPSKEQKNMHIKLIFSLSSCLSFPAVFLSVVPSVPRSFRIQQRHLDSIYVDWDVPAEPNGVITGYSLKYQTGTPSKHLKHSQRHQEISSHRDSLHMNILKYNVVCCSPPWRSNKALITGKETFYFTKAGKAFHVTLGCISLLHIIVHLNMHSMTRIPPKQVLESVINTYLGTLQAGKVLNRSIVCTLPASRVLIAHWNFHFCHSKYHQGRGAAV